MDDAGFERRHIWHPYSAMDAPQPVHHVERAKGVWLHLADGSRMIDAMSSWWCAAYGHAPDALVQALKSQADLMPHVMFGGLTHAPAISLARKLVAVLPDGLDRVFYSDSGSVAVEVAVKMAVQAQIAAGHPARTALATVRGGYHGDTWKAMSLCDPDTGMHSHFGLAVSAQHFVARPPIAFDADWPEALAQNGLAEVEALFSRHGDRIAAFVIEPVVQGAGGMRFYHPAYLQGLRALCDHYGILLIFDEIATGFGRTGKAFAMDHAQIRPDILCLGKALTGGMMSFAATIATGNVAAMIGQGSPSALMHGPTFMANPLACAVAGAAVDLWQSRDWSADARRIGTQLRAELGPVAEHPDVSDLRVLGAIGVIEMRAPLPMAKVHAFCARQGVWLRPFGRLLYTMPPFVTAPEEISRITATMRAIARGL
ncbi:adenosylmethionine--8-amino-7-oxononanoate transaminase [Paracoccus aestuariivivens]|uniref:Adenosylmethionine-8-amino-7-oxononanoate aminotransferase n=1 Tax=Paracoccus aestuariivivens TaxID=1820333 RepID=A0A6L6J8Q1_9RHOB|nr:adenosylmethionine--8-amino-7-oxononanoate transaminase [Paracoccus aestuariivivens]MTH78462.1 adenosylmethionine--8-amino-7-oxononanoate transaminase [Paracoccus aestuariivivens]